MSFSQRKRCIHDGHQEHVPSVRGCRRTQRSVTFSLVVGWDPPKDIIDYRMKVHLFGASSSPGCANFGLRRAGDDGEEFGTDAAAFIRKNFYVDDGLKSVSTVPEAIQLIKASQAICSKACLRLHKIVSNNKEVLEAFPVDDHKRP